MTTTVRHPLFARLFVRAAAKAEAAGQTEHRRELLAGLTGRVLEVGAGHGLNFAHYPNEVSEVVAVEPEPYLRGRAEQAARQAPVPITVVAATAETLPFEDDTFDAAVVSQVLCSVADQGQVLAALRRVVRPEGQLRFYEHVAADTPGLSRVQRAADLVWPHVAGGCHTHRETIAAIRDAGFVIESCRRFPFRPCLAALPVTPHALGSARNVA